MWALARSLSSHAEHARQKNIWNCNVTGVIVRREKRDEIVFSLKSSMKADEKKMTATCSFLLKEG
jgi:hypothetical protein